MESRVFRSRGSRMARFPIAIILLGLLAMAGFVGLQGWELPAVVSAVIAALGVLTLILVRRRELVEYEVDGHALFLRRGANEERIELQQVRDANLIDLATARDYVKQTVIVQGRDKELVTRYCGIPLQWGVKWVRTGITSLSISSFQRTLVLVRTLDDRLLILSPRSGEHMVCVMGKALARTRQAGS